MSSDPLSYFAHMTRLFGTADSLRSIDASKPQLPPVVCFIYHDRPRQGMTTTITYGLSEATHPQWTSVRPELIVCVNSSDESWGLAATELAEHLRGEHSFSAGSLFELEGPISGQSEMSGFVAYPPRPGTAPETRLILPGKTIELTGLYPVYECEYEAIREGKFTGFLSDVEFDPFDVSRPHLWSPNSTSM